MRAINLQELVFRNNSRENCYIAVLERNSVYEIVLVRVPPRSRLKLHRHRRPNNGVEIYVFHTDDNNKFRVYVGSKVLDNPIYVRIDSGEEHAVENLSDRPLYFYAIYIPPFREGEVELLES